MTKLQQTGHLFALVPAGRTPHCAAMRVRRQQGSSQPVPETTSADPVGGASWGWDGLPMVAGASVVIRATRAGELAAQPGAAA